MPPVTTSMTLSIPNTVRSTPAPGTDGDDGLDHHPDDTEEFQAHAGTDVCHPDRVNESHRTERARDPGGTALGRVAAGGPVRMEATGGFEPPDGGFADPCLAAWLRRLGIADGAGDGT
jgi:hypothetical protein